MSNTKFSIIMIALALIVFVLFVQGYYRTQERKPMPCQEDEVYVWVDTPHTAECINWDELP